MLENKIAVVSCTQKKTKEEFDTKTPLGKSIQKLLKLGEIDYYTPFLDNKKGLSECYNLGIEKYKDCDTILFCHDDLFLLDIFLREKLEKAFKSYDVVGVAGSSSFSLKNERISWHISPKESWSGFVEHPYINGVEGQTYMTYFGPVPKSVAVLDGLLICCKVKPLIDNNIRFQEQYKFHLYDTSFCLECLKKDLKLGVIGIHVQHNSHGLGLNSDEYIQGEQILKQQYGTK